MVFKFHRCVHFNLSFNIDLKELVYRNKLVLGYSRVGLRTILERFLFIDQGFWLRIRIKFNLFALL